MKTSSELTEANVTQLLVDYGAGSSEALEKLLPVVYEELRRMAGNYMRKESSSHTLQPTALVNEAYLRLIDQRVVQWKNRAHFFGVAAQVMRRILVDHARAKHAEKRGGMDIKVEFDEAFHLAKDASDIDLVLLDDALKRLALLDERQAKITELRYFAGLSIEETANALELSPATVKREWILARAWLFRELSDADQTNA